MPRTANARGNLPLELTSFVGRRPESGSVRRALADAHLVTLAGPGGTGKTRLALRVGAEIQRSFRDGVWFVDLTTLRSPELMTADVRNPNAIAFLVLSALGWHGGGDAAPSVEQLVHHLAEARALLILDNCEHLLDDCATLARALLSTCAGVRLIATSREPLFLDGETVIRLAPLEVPPPRRASGTPNGSIAALRNAESVELFVDRAQASSPEFQLTESNAEAVGEICRRLAGLPLAIELAAGWVHVLTPKQIVERLTDGLSLLSRGQLRMPERQRTLEGCIAWSFESCTPVERLLWMRASIFSGGFELDAAEGVCTDGALPPDDLLNVLSGLIDKSIVSVDRTTDPPRYRMLDVIRTYGLDRLAATSEIGALDSLRGRHRDWYSKLAARAMAEWVGPGQLAWIERVANEMPNIRAALAFSQVVPDGSEAPLSLCGVLRILWYTRGRLYVREASYWLEVLLQQYRGAPTKALVEGLNGAATVATLCGEVELAATRARQAREAASQLGDPRIAAIASIAEAVVHMSRGHLDDAIASWESAVAALSAERGPDFLIWRLTALTGLAMVEGLRGNAKGSAAHHEAVLAICRPSGESWFAGLSLWTLGVGLWRNADFDGASARLKAAIEEMRRIDYTMGTVWCVEALARVALDLGQPERAATLIGSVSHVLTSIDAEGASLPGFGELRTEYEDRTRQALGLEIYESAFRRGGGMMLDEAVAYAVGTQPAARQTSDVNQPLTELTKREAEIAALVAEGLKNTEIAGRLVISPRTAEGHVQRILVKLGLRNRSQLAVWVATQGEAASPSIVRWSSGEVVAE